jgi:adenylate kinase
MNKATGLIFLGPPGSGKGTQSVHLADTLNIPHISTGDILRAAIANATPLGQKAKAYMEQGELVPDELILDLIRERLQQGDAAAGWILDGFPRNVSQAVFLDGLLEQMDRADSQVVNLEVPDQVLIARLLNRGRQDDNEQTIRRRLEVYMEQTAPVIDYYRQKGNLHSVDGDRTPEEVTRTLSALLHG